MLMTSAALAGTISPQLQAEIDRTAPNLPISVIVNLSNQAPITLLNQEMNARHATMQERHMRVVTALQAAAAQSQGPVKQMLDEGMRRGDVLGYTCYWISNMIVAQVTHDAIYRLAARSDIDVVEPNFRAQLIEPISIAPQIGDEETRDVRDITPAGIRAIRAPDCWYHLGINGTGRLIGGMDTGVMGSHPALQTRWRGYNGAHPWQECWLDVLGNGTTSPVDNYGHGTHTMGTMTGLAPAESVGVAPGAKWISCNAIDQGVGSEFDNDVIHGFQWFADPDGNPNTIDDVPDVVQNSWGINEGFGGNYTDCDLRWWSVLDNLSAAGVVVTWSAGNEGPGAQTLRSPADRAATMYEAFSVGAVDATSYQWPYPIAGFSSRGPTGCNVPANLKIKPEVAAPGVQVWSAYNNGGYTYMDGTSMAGPHVAGAVALIRQANPNLTPDEVKQILMTTARDEGTAGEDNTFGWGFIDAYAAVQAAMVGLGHITGHVTNASWLNGPIQDAVVRVVNQSISWSSDPTGLYGGPIAAGTYTLAASKAGFRADTAVVVIHQNQITTRDFALVDNAGPAISGVTNNTATNDSIGPYTIQATATDPSTVTSVKLYYGINGGGTSSIDMTPVGGNVYTASLAGMSPGNRYDYYIWAKDGVNNISISQTYHLYITRQVFAYDCETTPTGWQMGIGGDTAVSGVWICNDPVGTTYGDPAWQVQPEDDHTTNPGHICFVTGNGDVGGAAGLADVDGGCTTLVSPAYSIGDTPVAFFSYWRWYAIGGNSADDTFAVDISGNGGVTWLPWERVSDNENSWTKVTKSIGDVFNPLPATVMFRFVACDQGSAGLVEAAIDDLSMDTFPQNTAGVPSGITSLRTELAQNTPNPFNPKTTIRFTLSSPAQTRLEIYDAAGRMIRVLLDETRAAGVQQVVWNGLDDAGRSVGSGVYFYRLKAGAFEQARRMTILK
jgi:hypothetical protein